MIDLIFLFVFCSIHAEIIFNAMQTFELVLQKIKTIFCALFSKIKGSFEEYHILILIICINLWKYLL